MEEVLFDREVALEKAMRLFWRKGYHCTSVKELLAEMNILNGSLYNTFKGKKNLFALAISYYLKTIIEFRINCYQQAPSFKEGIRAFFAQTLKDYQNPSLPSGCLVVNSIDTELMQDESLRASIASAVERLHSFFRDEIIKAQSSGQVSSYIDPDLTASILVDFSEGLAKASVLDQKASLMRKKVDYTLSVLGL